MKKEFVVGVTGASGVVYARRLLEVLCDQATVHIVISDTARQIAGIERVDLTGFDAIYAENSNLAADIASGSFRYDGMAIVPCSMKTLAAVSNGLADNLIARAADVCLKERRSLLLLLREMPLSRIHLKNMLAADEAGATVMVASPPFYQHPKTIDDLVDMGVEHRLGSRWSGYDA
jgi:4-hydroxy-3-polyprenylbenzoate decarboxylase